MIEVVAYNPEWKIQFDQLRQVYHNLLEAYVVAIEHVGSTSVPGLKAKPILDIDIIIPNHLLTWPKVKERLEQIGYHHVGDYGIKGREVFKRSSDKVPNYGAERIWPRHHLYVCVEHGDAVKNHLLLRDHLRKHPKSLEAYGQLKAGLAKRFPNDIDAYMDGKTNFIIQILQREGLSDEVVQIIRQQNEL